jgi:Predicted Fe-S oxidoreductases
MLKNLHVVKGVHFQPASFFGRQPEERNENGDFDERVTMFAVMDDIEKQTGGRLKKADLAPISTGHPLCCFCAAYIKEKNGNLKPMSSGGSCCGPALDDPLEIIKRDRDFVMNKWDVADQADATCDCCCGEPAEPVCDCCSEPEENEVLSLDDAIAMFKNNMFTISGMAFMDETNLDSERLKRCRVTVFSPDERLIPFCGYYTVYNK